MAKVLCWRKTELDVSEMHFILPVDNSLHKRKNLELPRCIIEQYKYLMHKVIQFRKEKSTRRVLEHWFVLKIWSGNSAEITTSDSSWKENKRLDSFDYHRNRRWSDKDRVDLLRRIGSILCIFSISCVSSDY